MQSGRVQFIDINGEQGLSKLASIITAVLLLGIGNLLYRIYQSIESENLIIITVALLAWLVVIGLIIMVANNSISIEKRE